MGFIDDKNSLFAEIGATKALNDNFPELNKTFSSFNTVRSKSGNLVPLLIDLLKVLIGSNIKKSFKDLIKKTDKLEAKMKKRIVKEIMKKAKESNFPLSGVTNPVLEIKVKDIDIDGTLKVDPETDLGKFYYGKAIPTVSGTTLGGNLPTNPTVQVSLEPGGDFTKFLFDVKKNGTGNWKNIMYMEWQEYNTQQDKIKVSIDPQYLSEKSFEKFLLKFLNSVKILDLSLLMTTILDVIFGTVSSLTDVGAERLKDYYKTKAIVDKILDREGLSEPGTPIIYDNSFFNFSKKERDFIDFKASSVLNGGNLSDLGCGTVESNIDIDDLDSFFNELQSIKPSLVKESLTLNLEKVLKKATASSAEEDRENILQNMFTQIWENLTAIILSQTFKPFSVILLQMGEALLNTAGINPNSPIGAPGININGTSLQRSSVEDYIQKFKSFNICMIKDIQATIVEFLFDTIKAEILKLVKIKVKKFSEDQAKNYKSQIRTTRELLKQVNNLLSFINNISG